MTFAQHRIIEQVRQLQNGKTHQEHYAREILTSDLKAVLAEIKKLTTAGRYKPKKPKNRLPTLWPEMDTREAKDVYEEDSPEQLAVGSEVTRKMVTEQLRKDRAAADEAKTRQGFCVQRAKTNSDGSDSAKGKNTCPEEDVEEGKDAAWLNKSAEQIAEELRARYSGMH